MNKTISELQIDCPKQITLVSMEKVLTKHYQRSLSPRTSHVTFNLLECNWCEIFALSLLSLWIFELNLSRKTLHVVFPRDPDVHRFLISYRFNEFLRENRISTQGEPVDGGYARAREAVAPSYPLTFVSEESFKSFLAELKDPNRLSILLSGMEESEIVKSGAFRSVLLKELGDNVFLHGDSKAAHLMMTKVSKLVMTTPSTRADALTKAIYETTRGLAGKSILQIVIGDKGPGIAKSLQDTYVRENNLESTAACNECDVIEYAFLYHSSRRSNEERLGEFLAHFAQGSSPPPTGLYQLKELVRSYRGVLYVRSGASFVAFDFTEHSNPKLTRSDQLTSSTGMCNFGGVQYLILVPTDQIVRAESSINVSVIASKLSPASQNNQEHYAIADFIAVEDYGTLDREAVGIHQLLSAVDRAGQYSRHRKQLFVIDFESAEDLSLKSLYFTLLELSRRQSQEKTIFAINANQSILTPLLQELPPTKLQQNQYTVVFNDEAIPSVFWITTDTHQLVGSALALDHLSTATVSQIEERSLLIGIPREAIRNGLEAHILSPKSKIFSEDAKVLLLSNSYCLGYFEITKLFRNERSLARIARWLTYHLMELEPKVVVSLGTTMGNMIEAALKAFRRQSGGGDAQHINLRTDNRGRVLGHRLLLIEPTKTVMVATDVIGTAGTVLGTLKRLRHTKVERVLAVVDAREIGDQDLYSLGSDLEVASIVCKPLRYFRELPTGWFYHEIFQVDHDTHVLVREIVKPLGPLWIESHVDGNLEVPKRSNFLGIIVMPEASFFSGHFVAGKKHMTYMFDVATIAANHEVEIVSAIVNDIHNAEATKTPSERKSVKCLLFPQFNRGLDRIARKVASRYADAVTLTLTEAQLRTLFDQQSAELKDRCVVLLDDATDSGETVFRLIDIAERMGASRIYAYVLINRGASYAVRRLEKLKQYGAAGIHIRYLADAQLPSYVTETCPLCDRYRRLHRLVEAIGPTSRFAEYLKRVSDPLEQQAASSVGGSPDATRDAAFQVLEAKKLALTSLLAEAEVYPELRHDLTAVLKNHQVDLESALALVEVLARENFLPTNEHCKNSRIFYSSFNSAIQALTKSLLERQDISLSPEQVWKVLAVADAFQELFIVDNIHQYLSEAVRVSEDYFSSVALSALESKACHDNPGILAGVFTEISTSIPPHAESIQGLCDEMRNYWQTANQERSRRAQSRLEAYRELQGGRTHDLHHQYRNLMMRIQDRQIEDLQEAWTAFRTNLVEILSLMRFVIAFGVSSQLTKSLSNMSSSLGRAVRHSENLFPALDQLREDSGAQEATILFRDSVTGTMALSTDISENLDKLRTNLKESLYVALQNCKHDIESRQIECIRELPDELYLVFGEKTEIMVALINLVENVCRWSGAKRLFIVMANDQQERMTRLNIYDDGKGPNDLFFGVGLNRVKEIIGSVNGRFDLVPVPPGDPRFADGFRTVARLELCSVLTKKELT